MFKKNNLVNKLYYLNYDNTPVLIYWFITINVIQQYVTRATIIHYRTWAYRLLIIVMLTLTIRFSVYGMLPYYTV